MSSLRPKSLRAQKLKEAKDLKELKEAREEQKEQEAQKVKSVLRAKRLKECKLIREAKKVQEEKEAKLAAEQEEKEAKLAADLDWNNDDCDVDMFGSYASKRPRHNSEEDEKSRSVRIAALVEKRREKAKAASIALRAKRGMELEGDYCCFCMAYHN